MAPSRARGLLGKPVGKGQGDHRGHPGEEELVGRDAPLEALEAKPDGVEREEPPAGRHPEREALGRPDDVGDEVGCAEEPDRHESPCENEEGRGHPSGPFVELPGAGPAPRVARMEADLRHGPTTGRPVSTPSRRAVGPRDRKERPLRDESQDAGAVDRDAELLPAPVRQLDGAAPRVVPENGDEHTLGVGAGVPDRQAYERAPPGGGVDPEGRRCRRPAERPTVRLPLDRPETGGRPVREGGVGPPRLDAPRERAAHQEDGGARDEDGQDVAENPGGPPLRRSGQARGQEPDERADLGVDEVGAEQEDDEHPDESSRRPRRPERLLGPLGPEGERPPERRDEPGEKEGEDSRPGEAGLREDAEVEGRRVIGERHRLPEEVVGRVGELGPEGAETAARDRVLPGEGEGPFVEKEPLGLGEGGRFPSSERLREPAEEGAPVPLSRRPREGRPERERDQDRKRPCREGHPAAHARPLPRERPRDGPEDEDEGRHERPDEAAPRARVGEKDEEPRDPGARPEPKAPRTRRRPRKARREEERGRDAGRRRVGEGRLRAPPQLPVRRAQVRDDAELLEDRGPSRDERDGDESDVEKARTADLPPRADGERVEARGQKEGRQDRDRPRQGLLRVEAEAVDDPGRRDVAQQEVGRPGADPGRQGRKGGGGRDGPPERRQGVQSRGAFDVVDRPESRAREVRRERNRGDDRGVSETEGERRNARNGQHESRQRQRPEGGGNRRGEEQGGHAPDDGAQERVGRQEDDGAGDGEGDPAGEGGDTGQRVGPVHGGLRFTGSTGGRASCRARMRRSPPFSRAGQKLRLASSPRRPRDPTVVAASPGRNGPRCTRTSCHVRSASETFWTGPPSSCTATRRGLRPRSGSIPRSRTLTNRPSGTATGTRARGPVQKYRSVPSSAPHSA